MERSQSLRWTFFVPGMPFVGDTLERESLGGSESAALYLGRELSRLGDSVFLFTAAERSGVWEGVSYLPGSGFRDFAIANAHDVCVVQRAPELFGTPMASRLNILWQHDMTLGRHRQAFAGSLWNVDRVALLSRYMVEHYKAVHGIDEDLVFLTRNGISLEELAPHLGLPRDPHKIMYTSRPERGLDVMLEHILPELLERDPRYRLCVSGYDNKSHTLHEMYARIDQLMRAHGDRVQWLGHLTHAQLYEHYATAHLLVYPTPSPQHHVFDEISWISGMEAQASGLPVVSSRRGAIPETLATEAGTLVEVPQGGAADPEYVRAFVQAIERYRDPGVWQAASDAGRQAASTRETAAGRGYDWAGVARQWHDEAVSAIEARNDCPQRLARHLSRRSDVAALRLLAERTEDPQIAELARPLDWAFDPETYRAHYSRPITDAQDVWDADVASRRLHHAAAWVAGAQPSHVLDVGSWNGAFAVVLRQQAPKCRYTGLEINPEVAERARRHLADVPGADIVCGQLADVPDGAYDAVFAGEILEHQPEPWTVLESIEAKVKPGGLVVLTVPSGPWEEDLDPARREHLWELEIHDIADMVSAKPEADIQCMCSGFTARGNEPVGWTFIAYRADHLPVPPIDLERKLRLQRPRQTLSVAMIAGGEGVEDTLGWCLAPLRRIADEIVIADSGMSATARQIAEAAGARIIASPSPLADGFDVARNAAVDAATSDWILWVDTDERLLRSEHIGKYLRANCYAGYSIRQHHFAVDTVFTPDMPVRLFRREGWKGEPIRFVGMIHEHPELGVNRGPGPVLILPEVHIAHVGYLTEDVRRRRFQRNHPLLARDQERYPDRILQKHFVMRDNSILINFTLQRNGGRITPEITAWAEENRQLYKEFMVGRNDYLHIDPTPYLAQALRVLNRGIDVSFNVGAGRDGQDVPLNGGGIAGRFESVDDAVTEITQRVRQSMAPYEAAIW